jgi:hypothetical protein
MKTIPDDPSDVLDEWDDQIYKVYGDIPDEDREAIKGYCLIVSLAGIPCDPLLLLSGMGVPKPRLLDNLEVTEE